MTICSQLGNRLKLWAARVLDVSPDEVVDVETETLSSCPSDTCEYHEIEIVVTLGDGRRFQGVEQFGDFLSEIVRMELDADGRLTRWNCGKELFALKLIDPTVTY